MWIERGICGIAEVLKLQCYIMSMLLPSTYYGEGNGTPLQYSCLENPMDRGAWKAAVHGLAKSLTWLNDFTFTFYFHALKKEMATHSSVLAWRIPGTGEPGGLPSMGSHKVRHDWSNLAAAAAVVLIKIYRICSLTFMSSWETAPLFFNHYEWHKTWYVLGIK